MHQSGAESVNARYENELHVLGKEMLIEMQQFSSSSRIIVYYFNYFQLHRCSLRSMGIREV